MSRPSIARVRGDVIETAVWCGAASMFRWTWPEWRIEKLASANYLFARYTGRENLSVGDLSAGIADELTSPEPVIRRQIFSSMLPAEVARCSAETCAPHVAAVQLQSDHMRIWSAPQCVEQIEIADCVAARAAQWLAFTHDWPQWKVELFASHLLKAAGEVPIFAITALMGMDIAHACITCAACVHISETNPDGVAAHAVYRYPGSQVPGDWQKPGNRLPSPTTEELIDIRARLSL